MCLGRGHRFTLTLRSCSGVPTDSANALPACAGGVHATSRALYSPLTVSGPERLIRLAGQLSQWDRSVPCGGFAISYPAGTMTHWNRCADRAARKPFAFQTPFLQLSLARGPPSHDRSTHILENGFSTPAATTRRNR